MKAFLRRVIPRPLQPPARYALIRARAVQARVSDWYRGTTVNGVPLPPPLLRLRVHGEIDRDSFLKVGKICWEDVLRALGQVDREPSSLRDVLDFGCGCGRVLRWAADQPYGWKLNGTDMDPQAIGWCRESLRFGTFSLNNPRPPLAFPDQSFDLITAISVFTHLDEEMQFQWLEELRRIVRRGGLLIATTRGEYAQSVLDPAESERMRKDGFVFQIQDTGRFKLDGLPDFYQVAFHSREYVLREWSRLFRILLYQERGCNRHQDLVVLQPA